MRRFTFTTDATPNYAGIGVDWEDGSASYRVSLNGSPLEPPIYGQVSDLVDFYGGLEGFSVDYQDDEA